MYETHFGLRQRPFPAVADSECYYPATSHERALAQLQQAIEEDECLALLIGAPGTGKTKLCHRLLDRLGESVSNAFLTQGRFPNRTSFLQTLVYDLSLPHEGRSEQELRLCLTDFLLKNRHDGRRMLLVLDEAQHLEPDLLEELRLLGNLEGRTGRAFQMILAAQPAVWDTLRLPELAALNQRMAVCARLDPLGLHEAADYLVYHLRAAGGKPEHIISDEALEILARGTRGVPRLLNRAMNQALTVALVAGAALVDAEAALESLSSFGLVEDQEVPIERSDSAEPLEQVQEEKIEMSAKPALALQDGDDENQRRAALALQDPGDPRRPFASPRRPA
jgi:general secretion pathway protein A